MDNVTFDRCNCIECDWEGVDMNAINFDKSNVIEHEHKHEPGEEEQVEE